MTIQIIAGGAIIIVISACAWWLTWVEERERKEAHKALKFANATIDRLRSWIGETEWVDFVDENQAFFDLEGGWK